jgi:hypothetical protein
VPSDTLHSSSTAGSPFVLAATQDGCVSLVDVDRGCVCFILAAHRGAVNAMSVTLGTSTKKTSHPPPPSAQAGPPAAPHLQVRQACCEPHEWLLLFVILVGIVSCVSLFVVCVCMCARVRCVCAYVCVCVCVCVVRVNVCQDYPFSECYGEAVVASLIE